MLIPAYPALLSHITTNMKPIQNVFACLVHESFECILDLLQNLRYFDPQSRILLYNGGEDTNLLPPDFPWENYNATVHPAPQPMRWGRLHDFVFDSLEFLLRGPHFDTLTIVDSDQLMVRHGYTGMLTDFLAAHPDTGLLGMHDHPLPYSTPIWPVRKAWEEKALWEPLLNRFPNGEQQFPHWTLWPTTVITRKAAEDLHAFGKADWQLQQILKQTRIEATEEILFPTLVALNGHRVYQSPCNYRYVRWRSEMGYWDWAHAIATADIWWMHPVPRDYSHEIREHGRNLSQAWSAPRKSLPRMSPAAADYVIRKEPVHEQILKKTAGISGWLSEHETLGLCAIVESLARNHQNGHALQILEVGTYQGKSSSVLGLALKVNGVNGELTTIDPHEGVIGALDQGTHQTESTWDAARNTIEKLNVNAQVRLLKQFSFDVVWDKPLDCLFIDGLHDYPNVARDYHHFARHLKPGAWVAFHDYSPHWPGVRSFVDELLDAGNHRFVWQADSLIVLKYYPNDRALEKQASLEEKKSTFDNQPPQAHVAEQNGNPAQSTGLRQDEGLKQIQKKPAPSNIISGNPPFPEQPRTPPSNKGRTDATILKIGYPDPPYTPTVSFVIPVLNEGVRIYLTLEALLASTAVDYEVIVVDDGSDDGCCDFLRREKPQFEKVTLVTQHRKGVSGARNSGANHATGQYILFMDAHCYPKRGWLEKIVAELDTMEGGIVAPALSVAGNAAVKGYGLTLTNAAFGVNWLGWPGHEPADVPLAGGGCMAMRRDFFEGYGRFDSFKTFGVEDIEICIRSWRLGFPVRIVPTADVIHYFKPQTNFKVNWTDYMYNLLRLAVLHFEGSERTRILDTLKSRPAYHQALEDLFNGDVWERNAMLGPAYKIKGAEWLRRFNISI